MIPVKLLHVQSLPIYEQLAMEEALLRVGSGNWCLINEGSPSAIVMGISAKPEEVINRAHFEKKPIPIIRRFSGGGTVVVEEKTIFVTFIFEKKALGIENCPHKLLEWSSKQYEAVFSHTDFRLVENDYVIGNKKVGGNAQYFTKDRLLHHTSFLWDYSPELMKHLSMPPKIPEYRKKRSHEEFLTTLNGHFSSKKAFVEGFKTALASQFLLTSVSKEEILPVQVIPHRKALTIMDSF